jgi:hypothetical protein
VPFPQLPVARVPGGVRIDSRAQRRRHPVRGGEEAEGLSFHKYTGVSNAPSESTARKACQRVHTHTASSGRPAACTAWETSARQATAASSSAGESSSEPLSAPARASCSRALCHCGSGSPRASKASQRTEEVPTSSVSTKPESSEESLA